MAFFICWVVFSASVGYIGKDKSIGFWGFFLISVAFSPVLGFIIVLCVPDKLPPQQFAPQVQISKADELVKFKKLLDDGVIDEKEYAIQKGKLLNV